MLLYCSQGHENPPNSRFCAECGQQLPLAIGQTIENRYLIVRQLGQGGFGCTFLAEDINCANQSCVLKAFAPQDRQPEQLRKAKELFEREARVLYQLKHPQIPAFRELLQANLGGQVFLFLVQDYVEGDTYRHLLSVRNQGAGLGEVEVRQLLLQILPVLSYIHSLNVVHRDISPDNLILRSSDLLPVLIDFGGVKQLAASRMFWFNRVGLARTRLGKQGYAPEEQMQQGKIFPSSDLYALAVTALVLLTGKEPQELYDGNKGIWLWGRAVSVSPHLEAVLRKMLAYKPADRYHGAEEVLYDLQLHTLHVGFNCKRGWTQINADGLQLMNSSLISCNSQLRTVNLGEVKEVAGVSVSKCQFDPGVGCSSLKGGTRIVVPSNSRAGLLPGWMFRVVGTGLAIMLGMSAWTLVNEVVRSSRLGSFSGAAEQQWQEQLRLRRQALTIKPSFFDAIVDAQFYAEHPDVRGRSLKKVPKDARLRQEWDASAQDLLNRLEQARLSPAARRRLGSYSQQDYASWKEKADQGLLDGLTMEQLEKQADEKFARLFPRQQREKLDLETFGQIWYAIFSDEFNQSSKHNIQ